MGKPRIQLVQATQVRVTINGEKYIPLVTNGRDWLFASDKSSSAVHFMGTITIESEMYDVEASCIGEQRFQEISLEWLRLCFATRADLRRYRKDAKLPIVTDILSDDVVRERLAFFKDVKRRLPPSCLKFESERYLREIAETDILDLRRILDYEDDGAPETTTGKDEPMTAPERKPTDSKTVFVVAHGTEPVMAFRERERAEDLVESLRLIDADKAVNLTEVVLRD